MTHFHYCCFFWHICILCDSLYYFQYCTGLWKEKCFTLCSLADTENHTLQSLRRLVFTLHKITWQPFLGARVTEQIGKPSSLKRSFSKSSLGKRCVLEISCREEPQKYLVTEYGTSKGKQLLILYLTFRYRFYI
ncbi:thrombopoietin receptor [Platysternon megacephalum]|uniref:Thrombopoietin receptor n=1 Tax=Platysternon megacephalum TaxID=55544 RepID=A0A4D9E8I3_9SAUR|nr:thrombopoietin receptor [Platysternon megacephalum]